MPTARRMETPTKSPSTAQSSPADVSPVLKAGSTACSADQPSTQASATVSAPKRTLPSVERVKTHGSRRMATASTANPSRMVEARADTRSPYAPPPTSFPVGTGA